MSVAARNRTDPASVLAAHARGVTRRNHWVVRLTHWVNAIALPLMVASGLRIFNAHPAFARPGERFPLNPWEGRPVPAVLTLGGWLAGARHWHFAVMWLLVANGLVYVAFLFLHGEWRDLAPRRGDLGDAWQMLKFYLFVRPDHPRQGKHNALQKLSYLAMPLLTAVIVLSGLAIWKPVSLGFAAAIFVNYKWARFAHFAAMVLLVLLALGHIFMVFAVDPYAMRAIIAGWYDERWSPEARNARPFYHLFGPGRNAPLSQDRPS
ncbi:MAG: cytochrome b/b6 domain-containing protein [Gemmatimonadaceae bacterium]